MFTVEVKSDRKEDICLLIKVDNHSFNYICDCGEAKALSVKECQDTNAVFLSHTHIDHFVNFDTLLRHQIGTGKKVVICGPNGIADQVQNRIKSYCWNLIEEGAITYEIREILDQQSYKSVVLKPPFWEQEVMGSFEEENIFIEKDFNVEFEILDHKTDSIAYLFKAVDKTKIVLENGFRGGKWVAELKNAFDENQAETTIQVEGKEYKAKELFPMVKKEIGEKVGIIMDHDASPENHSKILKKFGLCDEVYIECFYKDEDKELAKKNYHSYASMSGKIMKECEVKRAYPIHFSRKYKEEDIEKLIAQFEKAYANND
ncbi:peptidase [Flammeovirga sp. SJP92]|uniref:peptidase n=1 Tax=Flammeovirga sp. SJP92 TaxID=1775430 RepID=UPI00078976EC|nr:peptidase [Flammeovirga sp. SJP92]KXX66561.1 peptidase [Flammeovirga sp. SJP92]